MLHYMSRFRENGIKKQVLDNIRHSREGANPKKQCIYAKRNFKDVR